MSAIENPAAFASPMIPEWSEGAVGMTLRDWFAGMTLASASALPFGQTDYEHRARVAYAQADAMLAERSKS